MELLVIILILAVLLISGVWIGCTLFVVSLISVTLFSSLPVHKIMSSVIWNNINSSTLMALPLFILMGEVLVRTKISEKLFEGLTPWLNRLPGSLLHVNVVACAFFAAISGSVAATTATVGKITLPELNKRHYSEKASIGTLASAGTLGILIPPSMPMLVYGVIANVSIGKLFVAGLVPGIGLMALFSAYIIIISLLDKTVAPKSEYAYSFAEKMASLKHVFPVLVLIALVLGSIYKGLATPTEAAALGVMGSFLIAVCTGCLTREIFREIIVGTVKTSSMIMLILIGASFFSTALGHLGVHKTLCGLITSFGANKITVIVFLTIIYLFLGCLLDGFSMIVMTVPLFLPLVSSFGFDPIWFGIYIVLMVQIANITPPVGFNIFLLSGITDYSIGEISRAVIPYILIMVVFTGLITVFPKIILFLPSLMIR